MPSPPPLIEVSGPPRERGRQYGEKAASRIRRGIEHYSEQLGADGLDWPAIRELAREFEPSVARFDADMLEEMRGIAEGADVEPAAILLLNARTEILKLAKRRRDPDPDGCTAVVVLPGIAAQGKLIQAQNWDWKAECAETAVVLKIRREDGPDVLTFTEAGGLARNGMNAAGISITANYLESDRDYRSAGVPLALIRRKALMEPMLALAMRTIYCTPKSASNNMTVSHAEGVCIDFECAPDESFQVHPENGLLVHANHWQSPVALSKLKDTGVVNTPDSLYRDLRVRELLGGKRGRITPEDVKLALFDEFQWPWSVCRPPRPNLSNNLSATVAQVVMTPADGVMEVAMLPALNRNFTRYTLPMDIKAARSAA
ncbi:C45 family autoproteolytic acyltransferase/hydolase [Sabulicella rubraurantiaca]|uniref:C45 family autoproteolytic acyltransferase/hydolase n=1 Tax=Sabulicella rubraurantiaca TaxID=2811429 RepID=UPI001A96E85C|nr:C45 family peptidase [Sabulicella rubraurantiaca]